MTEIPFTAAAVDVAAYRELGSACSRLRFLPTFRHGLLLDVAVPDAAPAALAAIRRLTHQEVRHFPVSPADFARALAALESEAAVAPALLREEPPRCPESWESHRRSGREIAVELVRIGHGARASDLLLDEQEEWTDVALKIDGRKEVLPPLDRDAGAAVLKAFKQMGGLSTQAAPAPQTGAATLAWGAGQRADLRIEVIPTVHGESLVARLQDRARQLRRMEALPFDDPAQRRLVEDCLARRQGLILATGPTGHGKTTTLYACLGRLDRSLLNIRTLEDPVEFVVPWITQIPVGPGTGRDFGGGLKSLLRQAPHVILLGEIRDAAAAQTCVEAADTGHLLLATLHTRDAIGAVARLLDLGLTGRQISSALLLVIAQRLVRGLCPRCRRPTRPAVEQCRHFEREGLPVPDQLWEPAGCPSCEGRGERGLLPIFELLHPPGCAEVAERIGQATLAGFDERALRACWREKGGSPLVRDGLRLAAAGRVAYAEVAPYADPSG